MYVEPPVYREEGVQESYDLTVDEEGKELRSAPYKGWFSYTIINNDDEDSMNLLINGQSPVRPTIIKAGEHRTREYEEPTVWRIFLYTEKGKSVNARVEVGR